MLDDLLNGLCQCENINIQDGVDGKLITLVTVLRDFSQERGTRLKTSDGPLFPTDPANSLRQYLLPVFRKNPKIHTLT